ncbi:MAG: coenzyme F420-0:L-glutamate ligase [Candidatus Bathyarchaeota archaeon]|nr:MAG: coenzyme F420-0:L-glutamate ligase [Candidatus Bathyarchaeota archaeon]
MCPKTDSHHSGKNHTIQIIDVKDLPVVKEGDNLAELICNAAEQQRTAIQESDILVVTHVVVSRAEENIVNLDMVVPSDFAKSFAQRFNKDPALIETVLRESRSVVRMGDGKLITETKHGIICANAGVDQSNVPGERNVALLPENPDRSAQRIRREIRRLTGKDVAVIISDTHGRPLRKGEINIAIGVAGICPIRDRRGEKDLFGQVLRVKQTAIADELCSAAELVIGQANERIPVAIIRGYSYPRSEEAKATELTRPKEKDLFI